MKRSNVPTKESTNLLSMMGKGASKKKKKTIIRTECNICGKVFQKKNRFEKFCFDCKEDSELYHSYSD